MLNIDNDLEYDFRVLKYHPETRQMCIVEPKYLPKKERLAYESYKISDLDPDDLLEITSNLRASQSPYGKLNAVLRTVSRIYPELRQYGLWEKACADLIDGVKGLPSRFWPRVQGNEEGSYSFHFQVIKDIAVTHSPRNMLCGASWGDVIIFPRPYDKGKTYLWCGIFYGVDGSFRECVLSATSAYEALDLITRVPVGEQPVDLFTRGQS